MSNNKKILIISKQLDVKPNRSVYFYLAKKGYSIDIIVPNKKVEISIDEKKYFNVVDLQSLGTHPRLFFIPKLFFLIKNNKYDFIFIENDICSIICFQVCFLKLFIKNMSIMIFTLENINKNYRALAFEQLCKLKLKKTIIFIFLYFLEIFNKKYISTIFVYNNESYSIHKRKFSNSAICKIPLGIDHSLFAKNKPKNFPIKIQKNNKFIIGIFGRIDKNRGSDLIFKLLNKKKNQIKFEILLDCFHDYMSSYSLSLIKKFKLNFPKRLHLINPSHENIVDYIKASDLIILPSIETKNIKEQYGRLIVEAKLAKTLVIVSDVGAFPETMKNKNLIFKSNFISLEKKFEKIFNLNYHDKKKLIFINYKNSMRLQTSVYQAEKIYEKIK